MSKWLQRSWICVADGGYGNAKFGWACRDHGVTLVTRLPWKANLYDFAPTAPPRRRPGRPRTKGCRQLSIGAKLIIHLTSLLKSLYFPPIPYPLSPISTSNFILHNYLSLVRWHWRSLCRLTILSFGIRQTLQRTQEMSLFTIHHSLKTSAFDS